MHKTLNEAAKSNFNNTFVNHLERLTHHDASIVHASGSGKLQANAHVASPWLSPGMPTRRAVTTIGSNYMVAGEDHMFGQLPAV